jgi:DNA-binding NtrC family response regulator
MKILLVEDETIALKSINRLLKRRGFKDVELCDKGSEAIRIIKDNDFDIVLLDLLMPDVNGLKVFEATKPFKTSTEFIILTALDDAKTAVKAIQLGVYDYLVKPVDNEQLIISIQRAFEHKGLLTGLAGTHSGSRKKEMPEAFCKIITQDSRMKEILSYVHVMTQSNNSILITGDSGTGKELLAQCIHRAGLTPDGPFIAINVSSIPATLFESHVFGHVKGAFTGAERDQIGFFEQANKGTLFLDEIGELPRHLQVKLLRVLEEKSLTRIGDTKSIALDLRIISATNADLDESCQKGRFRLDLLYRLKSVHIHLPPLKERETDIPLLASHFLKKSCELHNKEVCDFSLEAMEALINREYPGNIRELAQIVENAAMVVNSPQILPRHLGMEGSLRPRHARRLCSLRENDRNHVVFVLTHTNGNRTYTAQTLGITVRQLQRKIAEMKKDPYWHSIIGDI